METLERASLAELTTDALLNLIKEQQLRDGDPIPATGELADRLGVSRPVVREAVATLAGLGLVHRQQGRESVVTTPGSRQLERLIQLRFQIQNIPYEDIQEFREFVEVDSARLAARHATEPDLADLSSALEALRAASNDSELHDADVEFHRVVARAGGNDLMRLVIDAVSPLLRQLRTRVWAGWVASGGGLAEIIDAHAEILDAISRHDESAAAAAMTAHMAQARSGLND